MDRNEFNLTSLALTNTGGVKVTYFTERETAEGLATDTGDHTMSTVPHPDMRNRFLEGQKAIINALYKGASKKFMEEAAGNISCHKISISGKESKKAIVITGKIHVNGIKAAFNLPKALISTNPYGIDLEKMVAQLEDEAHAYMFENKKAQMDVEQPVGPGNDAQH